MPKTILYMILTLIPTVLVLTLVPEHKTTLLAIQAWVLLCVTHYISKAYKTQTTEGRIRLEMMSPPSALRKGPNNILDGVFKVVEDMIKLVCSILELFWTTLFFLVYLANSLFVLVFVLGRIKQFEDKKAKKLQEEINPQI